MIRYLLFYGCLIVVLSLSTYVMDLVYFFGKYGSTRSYGGSPGQYMLLYVIIGYLIFPVSIGYNYFINHILPCKFWMRLISGIMLGFLCIVIIRANLQYGFYIGEGREIKNLWAAIIAGIAIELIRCLVVKSRDNGRWEENRDNHSVPE